MNGNISAYNGGFLGTTTSDKDAPAFSFSADLDTGMYRRGTNSIGFSTGGTEWMYISSAGIVRVVSTGNDDRIAGASSESGVNTIARFITCTQAQYDGLTPDDNTLYIIV